VSDRIDAHVDLLPGADEHDVADQLAALLGGLPGICDCEVHPDGDRPRRMLIAAAIDDLADPAQALDAFERALEGWLALVGAAEDWRFE
jgi:hypothetical protein